MHLTPRQRAVARYLLGGWNPESIAIQLDIKQSTLKHHYLPAIRNATGHDTTYNAILFILRDPAWLAYVMEVQL